MAYLATGSVVRQLGALFEGGSMAGLSDVELLDRFAADRDEHAFAALVGRHGPMVLNVCREILGDRQHAEDAFQAVFLVLARRAGSIGDPDRLGNWLYGVALRTARCARRDIGRRRRREEADAMQAPGQGPEAPPADRPAIDREQAEALHDEIERLPGDFRLAVVLCYFEGLSQDEAAQRLHWPIGTLRSRLARARERLRNGLTRRGVVLSGAALATLLEPRTASASIPPLLCESTTRAAITFAARHADVGAFSASAAAMAREVLRSMLIHKLKFVALGALTLAALATGAIGLTSSTTMKEEPVSPPIVAVPRADPEPKAPDPDPARMTIAGRVLDPGGKPVKDADVGVLARPNFAPVGASENIGGTILLGQARTDAEGRFRIDAPRMPSARVYGIMAIAAAPGYGIGSALLNPDAERPGADLKLKPEQVRRVRLVAITGAPAKEVEVRVKGFYRPNDTNETDGAWVGDDPPKGLRAWPGPLKTDDDGRITLAGIGPGYSIALDVRDLRFARQDFYIEPKKADPAKEVSFALESAHLIEGRVLAEDNGRPIPNAVISVASEIHSDHANGFFTSKFRTDDRGHFIINPLVGVGYTLGAFPPDGEPYLIPQDQFRWPKGAVKITRDIKLPRGVLIRGKLHEVGTNRPVADARIQYMPIKGRDGILSGWQALVASGEDGSFAIPVLPGKGYLLVFGPTDDYLLDQIGSNRLYGGGPGGQRYYAHAIIPYDVKAGDAPVEVVADLKPAVMVKGRVEGPGGETITRGEIQTTLHIGPTSPFWRGFPVPVLDGRFEIHGIDPGGSTRIWILDPEREWGATVDLSGQQAGQEAKVRLQPCGTAKARFVGPDGKPIAKYQPTFYFVATPGPSKFSGRKIDRGLLRADEEYMANVERKHYWNLPRTDADGRIAFPSLIPGALYRIVDFSTVNDQEKGEQIRKDFTVKPGETLDLGEILIEKP